MPTFDQPSLDQPAVARPALVLFSGGQDSTTALFWAMQAFGRVEAIGFDYGQRHGVELDQAHVIAAMAELPFTVISLRGLLSGSALTEHEKDVGTPHERDTRLPATFVPGRNALFLTLAASHGYVREIGDLVIGVSQADYSGYPDCRIGFIQSMQRSLALALDTDVRIHTPLMYLTKAEIWKLAHDLGEVKGHNVLEVVREMSHTDYHGDRTERHDWGYGRLDNQASVLRARGYDEARKRGWI
jgi:7-cyano-7-deazaguanine synthase